MGALAALVACSSRNHSSDIPNNSSSSASGLMTIKDSPNGLDDVENLSLDLLETCTMGENQDIKVAFASDRLSYRIELEIRDIRETWENKECRQASTNRLREKNDEDRWKFLSCYVSLRVGSGNDINGYDTHRILPRMADYTYQPEGSEAKCMIRAKVNLLARVFEASDISCTGMARTIFKSEVANPVLNDKAVNLRAKDLRCNF